MNSSLHTPKAFLQPFIHGYRIIENEVERVNRVLPGTSLVMAFRYKGQVSYLNSNMKEPLSSAMVSGLRKSGRLINYARDTGNILVIFKEMGAHMFFAEPLSELFEHSVALNNFVSYKNVSVLEEQLAEAENNAQRIDHIEQFLITKLCKNKSDLLISAACEKIHAAVGNLRIKDLANTLCISQDAFEKRFRRAVGVTPKQFSYIIRMRSVFQTGVTKETLAEAAFNAGYFDQSHFNKDFKLFTGQTPTEFLRSPLFW